MADYTAEEWELIHQFDMEGAPPTRTERSWSEEDKLQYMRGQQQANAEFMGDHTEEMGQFGARQLAHGKRDVGIMDTGEDKYTLHGFSLPDELTDSAVEELHSSDTKYSKGLTDPSGIERAEKGGIYAYGGHNARPDLFFHESLHHEFDAYDKRPRKITDALGTPGIVGDKAREEFATRSMELFRGISSADYDRVNDSLADFGTRLINLGNKDIGHVDDVVELIDKAAPTLAEIEADYYLKYVGVPESQQPYKYDKQELKDKTAEFLDLWKERKKEYISPEDR